MNLLARVYGSSLGKKYIMAITGFLLFLFVIVHMLGNLQVYLGPEPMNAYAALLKARPGLLWTARAGLLLLAILHIASAVQLAAENRAARPETYEEGKPIASFASRTILVSGLIIFAFVIYHLMHFTFGVTNPEFMRLEDLNAQHDVYRMVVLGFSNPWVSTFYLISMGLLCLHLSHGLSSMFQSLGIRSRSNLRAVTLFARAAALVVFIGNCSIPISILAGVVK
ncbi:MAG TPA: succinate dehydrogenase cytochrome b subunit [Blastocatellia bacterium]|nr:succinate dehydrogenase cytochrome b subunit [Blastocatellia bacterium]